MGYVKFEVIVEVPDAELDRSDYEVPNTINADLWGALIFSKNDNVMWNQTSMSIRTVGYGYVDFQIKRREDGFTESRSAGNIELLDDEEYKDGSQT